MARRKRKPPKVEDYRHDDKRKNIPPAGLAAHGEIKKVPPTRFAPPASCARRQRLSIRRR